MKPDASQGASVPESSSADRASMRGQTSIVAIQLFSSLAGIAFGAFTWLFIQAYRFVITNVWYHGIFKTHLPVLILVVCTLGGFIVGLLHKYRAAVPVSLDEAMIEIKKTGRIEYDTLGDSVVNSFTSLVFGGAIGPEAGLTSIIGGLCTWLGDRNKALFKRVHAHQKVSLGSAIALWRTDCRADAVPEGTQGRKTSKNNPPYLKDYFARRKQLIVPAVVLGLITYGALSALTGTVSGFYQFAPTNLPTLIDFAGLIALVAVGLILGGWNRLLERVFRSWAQRRSRFPIAESVVAGIVLGLLGMALPLILFSGDQQTEILVSQWTTMTAFSLILLAFAKLVATRFILANGWHGGQIFPILFSGYALGFGCAALAAQWGITLDPTWCAAAVAATAATVIMRQPVFVFAFLVLLLPWQTWPALIVATFVVGWLLKALRKKRAPQGIA